MFNRSIVLGFLLLAIGGLARAQVPLPQVQLPSLPTEPLDRTVNGALERADPQRLRAPRQLKIRNLLRTNRTVLEADPRGAPIIRKEVIALSPTPAALDRARAAGFAVGRTRSLAGLDVSIVVLLAPQGMSTRRALERLRREDPDGTYDFNHVYLESGGIEATSIDAETPRPLASGNRAGREVTPAIAATGAAFDTAASGALTPRIGLIDGGIQRSHSVFNRVKVHEHGCTGGAVPSAHGTAVASLLVGQSDAFRGAAPGAELFAADVYCGLATGGALDSVAEAFAWMAREQVPVINISLVGPANVLLERIIGAVVARGHIVVAAVGNDGPSAPPLFPAAYPKVVAVTAVDAKRRVLVEACRGKHVDFSAPGANMSAAAIEAPFAVVRGTSFAAPIVAGLLARQVLNVDTAQAEAGIAALIAQATDLGAPGADKIYGIGLVGDELRPPDRLSSAAR